MLVVTCSRPCTASSRVRSDQSSLGLNIRSACLQPTVQRCRIVGVSNAQDTLGAEMCLDNLLKMSVHGSSSSSAASSHVFLLFSYNRLTSFTGSSGIPVKLKALTEEGVLKLAVVDELHMYVLSHMSHSDWFLSCHIVAMT